MDESNLTLQIDNLTVSYSQGKRWLEAVRDFSINVASGGVYGLVGESGSGKSTVALAVMGYLSKNGRIDGGKIIFDDKDLVTLSQAELRRIWGDQLALVPQDPLSSFNPSLRIGEQIVEVLRQHKNLGRSEAQARAVELLQMVRVPDPDRIAKSYPHEISGGMQQRVLIAIALSTEPKFLVLDEPTTGLDVTTQATVLDLFKDLIEERQTSALYVTHNLGVVSRVCDRVAVLYAGELVEDAPVDALFRQPLHPYTIGLLESVPQIGHDKKEVELQAIPGSIPALEDRTTGCVFAPRCLLALDQCFNERPPVEVPIDGRQVRCFRWDEVVNTDKSNKRKLPAGINKQLHVPQESLLVLDNLEVYFELGRTLSNIIRREPGRLVKAVDGIDLDLEKGQTLGIVGESGSGKTTLARAVVGLAPRTGGEIDLLGINLSENLSTRPMQTRKLLQYIFQNPEEALNPYMTIGQTLRRPFLTLLDQTHEQADENVLRLLEAVRMPVEYAERLPSQLSGGEKQRVAIARAFATQPDLLIADEPVSALDVSVQASILNLLRDLQIENNNALIFISHDLAVVAYVADVVAVMYVGHIMELVKAESLFHPPYHPYTEALLSAIPKLDPQDEYNQIRLHGDVPSQMEIPSGCPFHTRCPRFLGEICKTETPPWQKTEAGGRIFCHIPINNLIAVQSDGSAEDLGEEK